MDRFNEISHVEEVEAKVDITANAKHNSYLDEANLLREKHRNLRDNFDRLERIANKASEEFIEPRVQSLWRIARANNFTADELSSLKVELMHYESRLLKLRHLNAENALNKEKYKVIFHQILFWGHFNLSFFSSQDAEHRSKHDKYASAAEHIKKQERKVEKLQEIIEQKIFNHSEL